MKSASHRFIEAKKTVSYALIILIALTISKIIFGYLTSSIALLADGFHSLSDVIIVFIAFIVVSMLAKKPSERFPYGYYKLEDLGTLIISLIFIFIAYNLGYEAVTRILRGTIIKTRADTAFVVAILSAIISFIVSRIQEKLAVRYDLTSLRLNAKEMRYDAIASTLVGFSIVLTPILLLPLEELVTIIISFLILRIAVIGIKNSILNLLDAWSHPEILANIRKIVSSFSEVKKVKSIRIRKAGPLIFGDIIIGVSPELSIDETHEIMNSIESKLRKEIPSLSDIVIHAEPVEKREMIVCVSVEKTSNDELVISDHFGKAPLIAIFAVNRSEKSFKLISTMENKFIKTPKHSGIKLARALSGKGIDAVIIRNIGEAAFLALKAFMMSVYRTESRKIESALNDLINGKLEKLYHATKEE